MFSLANTFNDYGTEVRETSKRGKRLINIKTFHDYIESITTKTTFTFSGSV